jgi:hypothetical protein
MFFYRLGYWSHEDTGWICLFHTTEFSDEEFEDMVLQVTPDAVKRFNEERNAEYIEDCKENGVEPETSHLTATAQFSDTYRSVAEELCKRFGFVDVSNFTAKYSLFGWVEPLDKEVGWEGEKNPQDQRYIDRVRTGCPELIEMHDKIEKAREDEYRDPVDVGRCLPD